MNRIEIQRWPNKRRFLITNEHGSVQVDMLDEPQPTYEGSDRFYQAFLYALWVDEDSRKDGIATSLLDTAEECVRREGIDKVYLEWSLYESPHWVLDWYVRRGYNDVEFGNDNALLEKKL